MSHPLDTVDVLQKELISLKPIDTQRKQKIDKKFRLEFNYNSNHMEGNTLTYGETELLLIFGDTKGGHTFREYNEMRNHDVAFKLVEEWAKDKEHTLKEPDIKNLNRVILVEPFWKEAKTAEGNDTRKLIDVGSYKKSENSVRLENGEMLRFSSPVDTPIEMAELIDWYRSEEDGLHPVTLATMLHYKFVRIHPFDDGNGRVASLLMNYVLMRNDFPPVVIKSDDKVNYLKALHLADIGDYEPLITYIGQRLIWSQEIVFKGAKGECIDEPGDFDKRLKFLKARLNSDGKLEIRTLKSEHAIIQAWDTAILPLLQKTESKLHSLNEMFKTFSKSIAISPRTGGPSPKELGDLSGELKGIHYDISSLHFGYSFNGLRESPSFAVVLTIEIVFHKTVYDVQSNVFPEAIGKRYDDSFDEAELEYISESIGAYLLDAIEKHIDGKKS